MISESDRLLFRFPQSDLGLGKLRSALLVMKKRLPLLITLFIAASAHGSVWKKGQAFTPDETVVYKTVEGTPLELHIFYPDSQKPAQPSPAIVFFHGGGFSKGSPKAFYYACDYLASRGMVAISAQYRLGDQLKCLMDAKSAMRYVVKKAAEFGIDPDKIAAGGGSAGGHLAANIATSTVINEATDDTSISTVPKALVLFNPIASRGNHLKWAPEIAADFNYFEAMGPEMPPTLAMWGSEDKFITVEKMNAFQKKLTDAGVRCEIEIYQDQKHSWFDNSKEWVGITLGRADTFLASLGFLKGPPTIEDWIARQ